MAAGKIRRIGSRRSAIAPILRNPPDFTSNYGKQITLTRGTSNVVIVPNFLSVTGFCIVHSFTTHTVNSYALPPNMPHIES